MRERFSEGCFPIIQGFQSLSQGARTSDVIDAMIYIISGLFAQIPPEQRWKFIQDASKIASALGGNVFSETEELAEWINKGTDEEAT